MDTVYGKKVDRSEEISNIIYNFYNLKYIDDKHKEEEKKSEEETLVKQKKILQLRKETKASMN
jgi:hypothetical protein